jgi:hypothetical protein
MIQTQLCMSGYDCNSNPAQNPHSMLMTSGMASSCSVIQVQRRYHRPDNIKSNNGFHITNHFQNAMEVFIYFKTKLKPELLSTAQNLGLTRQLQGLQLSSFFKPQNGEKTQWRSTQERAR